MQNKILHLSMFLESRNFYVQIGKKGVEISNIYTDLERCKILLCIENILFRKVSLLKFEISTSETKNLTCNVWNKCINESKDFFQAIWLWVRDFSLPETSPQSFKPSVVFSHNYCLGSAGFISVQHIKRQKSSAVLTYANRTISLITL